MKLLLDHAVLRRTSSALLALALLGPPALSLQSFKLKSIERPELGLKMRIFKALNDTALDPHERQIKITWRGAIKLSRKQELDLSLSYFVIDKTAEYHETGDKTELLNGAIDLQDFLIRRELEDPEEPRMSEVSFKKPIKHDKRQVFQAWEMRRSLKTQTRLWFIESEAEIWGLMARSKDDVAPFVEAIETKILKTIRRSESAVEEPTQKDPYQGSELPNVEQRRAVLSSLPRSWQRRDTANFLVVTAIPKGGKNDKLVDAIAEDLEIMRSFYEKLFPPLEPLTELAVVRIFDSYDAYMAYGAPEGTGGYWDPARKELVLPSPGAKIKNPLSYRKGDNAMQTLYHEAMHQYLAYANGKVAPVDWFNEGYGDYCGGAQLDRRKDTVKQVAFNKERWEIVSLQVANDALPPLDKLLTMDRAKFYGQFAGLNYAFSWAFCYFLENERKKGRSGNPTYAAIPMRYLENLRAAAKAHGTLEEVYSAAHEATFGDIDLEQLETDWLAEMKTWKPPR